MDALFLSPIPRHHGTRRMGALLLACLMSGGCATWRTAPESPAQAIARYPAHVRVTVNGPVQLQVLAPDRATVQLQGGDQVELYTPTVEGSRFVGYMRQGDPTSRAAVPVGAVSSVEVQRVNVVRTAALVTIVGVPAVFLIVHVIQNIDLWSGGGDWLHLPGARP
jgi:hypothetical protein